MENKRIYLWDNLKFLLILFVVVGHFAEQYIASNAYKSIFIFMYAFHMPLFIFISGLFHNNKRIVEKVYTYIVIGYLCKILNFVIGKLMGQEVSLDFFNESLIPWFMFALAAFIVLTYVLRNLNQTVVLVIAILIACFAGYDKAIGDFLVISRILIFYPFYLLGSMLSEDKLRGFASKYSVKACGVLILLIWLFLSFVKLDDVYVLRPLFTGRNPFNSDMYDLGPLYRLLCYGISSLLCFAFIVITPSCKIPVVSEFGKRTLQVYFWHMAVVYVIVYSELATPFFGSAFGKLLWLFIGAVLTCILSLKVFSFPTSTLLKYSRKQG